MKVIRKKKKVKLKVRPHFLSVGVGVVDPPNTSTGNVLEYIRSINRR
jgi:hypothetical protein